MANSKEKTHQVCLKLITLFSMFLCTMAKTLFFFQIYVAKTLLVLPPSKLVVPKQSQKQVHILQIIGLAEIIKGSLSNIKLPLVTGLNLLACILSLLENGTVIHSHLCLLVQHKGSFAIPVFQQELRCIRNCCFI